MQANKYKNLTASGLVETGCGTVVGIVANSHTAGTIKLWDNTSAAGNVLNNTISLAVGERWIPFFGETFDTGLFVTIGGTADITVVYSSL